MMMRESVEFNGVPFTIETGRVAKQANGAAIVRYGDTMVLVTAAASDEELERDFLPLTVDYSEKMYAAGRIPGSYFRREGRPSVLEVLTCRIIDRPLRPLFPKSWHNETQIIALVLSSDGENTPDVLALTGASAALSLSDIPWNGPIAGIRIGRVDGRLIAFPTEELQKRSDMNITVACSFDAIVMVEGECKLVSEKDLLDGLLFAQEQTRPILELQEKMRAAVGKPKRVIPEPPSAEGLIQRIQAMALESLKTALGIQEKLKRYAAVDAVFKEIIKQLGDEYADRVAEVEYAFEQMMKRQVRGMVVKEGRRIDGRSHDKVRPITSEVGVLPRVHGSAIFTRGETQALATATLATSHSDQRIESVMGDFTKTFLLHYNFPPFSTGEVKRFGSPGRREIGHGNLAERALSAVLPPADQFPYVLRVVSEILESNGSSSMATVCGGSLALMDAGVPIKAPVAGIAMGLIKEGEQIAILSDILGDEDHLGDMDFKVAGTREGISAVQMDIKIQGLSREILSRALEQARQGRLHILNKMAETLEAPRAELSHYAPRITNIKVRPDRIREIIGPGGKTIRAIQDQSGAQVNVEDDGTVIIAAVNEVSARKALDLIAGLTAEAEMSECYRGRVKRVVDFGAFIEILPGTEGLCHISELDHSRVRQVTDICKEGDEIVVKVINIDRDGKIRLSRKEALDVAPDKIRSMV